jgi:hypothetical protein
MGVPRIVFPIRFLLLSVQYQMEMMKNLRHVNIDHLHVGWYQSTNLGSFINRALLESQFIYQHSIEESVVLIYGKAGLEFRCQRDTAIFVLKRTLFDKNTKKGTKAVEVGTTANMANALDAVMNF